MEVDIREDQNLSYTCGMDRLGLLALHLGPAQSALTSQSRVAGTCHFFVLKDRLGYVYRGQWVA